MKKKRIIFIIVLLSMFSICTFSYASTEFAGIFTLINPSATNVAFGLESGTANIWDKSPLGVWNNPAKLGYYKGIAYGNSHDAWFDNVIKGIYHDSSYLTFGWNGIGVLLPFVNYSNKLGTTLDYGEVSIVDPYDFTINTFYLYETCGQFAFGINYFEFVKNFICKEETISKIQKYVDFSLGTGFDYFHKVKADTFFSSNKVTTANIGGNLRLTPINVDNENLKFDISLGINFINIFKSKVTYKVDEVKYKYYLPYGNRTGVAGKLSFINIKNLADEYPLFYDISKYLFSIYASYDNSKYGDNPSTWGKGIELTLLDIFSWRSGEYNDIDGHIVGDCKGWGVNLNYKDVVSFQYNYVVFPGGELQDTQEKNDVTFNVDIIKLINELK